MVDRSKITPDASIESLDLKSVDIVMMLTALEEKFNVYIPMDGSLQEAKDVKSLIEAIADHIQKEREKQIKWHCRERGPEGRRVVISGMGAVCAAGVGAQKLWEAARDGVAQIRSSRPSALMTGASRSRRRFPISIPPTISNPNVLPFCDPFTQFAIVAADEAMAQAGFARKDIAGPRTAVIIGSGIGGMTTIEDGIYRYYVEGTRPEMLSVPQAHPQRRAGHARDALFLHGPTFADRQRLLLGEPGDRIGMQMIRPASWTRPSSAARKPASSTRRSAPGRDCGC